MLLPSEPPTLVMGVLNVTPDSFSDGDGVHDGDESGYAAAVARGLELAASGAHIVDVGGESTRPGSNPVPVEVELRRVEGVVAALSEAGAVVSIDTSKPAVARAALDAGAGIVNDVTGFGDPEMRRIAAASGAGVVVMHMQGEPGTMQDAPTYDDVVAEVREFLLDRAALLEAAGVTHDRICLDPGIGFGKTFDHNLELLGALDEFVATGYPVLVGTSRKGFLGALLRNGGIETEPAGRDPATAATTALAVAAGVRAVRVHDVATSLQVVLAATAIVRAQHRRTRI